MELAKVGQQLDFEGAQLGGIILVNFGGGEIGSGEQVMLSQAGVVLLAQLVVLGQEGEVAVLKHCGGEA